MFSGDHFEKRRTNFENNDTVWVKVMVMWVDNGLSRFYDTSVVLGSNKAAPVCSYQDLSCFGLQLDKWGALMLQTHIICTIETYFTQGGMV